MSRRRAERRRRTVAERLDGPIELPWLPEARVVPIARRGEMFVRVHEHADPSVPTLALFHGWTASSDLQFFPAYEALAERYSFVGIDHRGHGRGLRTTQRFCLEDAADDMAAVLDELGIERVTTVGYSMGGPISMHFARRHPDRVDGLVVQATALEWHATRREQLTWYGLPAFGAALRSWAFPRYLRRVIARVIPTGHELERYLPWILGEMQRGASQTIVEAGRSLSHHDASDWAGELARPAASLITTRDHLVRPRKQRELAAALGATVHELHADHLATLSHPAEYVEATIRLLDELHARIRATADDRLDDQAS